MVIDNASKVVPEHILCTTPSTLQHGPRHATPCPTCLRYAHNVVGSSHSTLHRPGHGATVLHAGYTRLPLCKLHVPYPPLEQPKPHQAKQAHSLRIMPPCPSRHNINTVGRSFSNSFSPGESGKTLLSMCESCPPASVICFGFWAHWCSCIRTTSVCKAPAGS